MIDYKFHLRKVMNLQDNGISKAQEAIVQMAFERLGKDASILWEIMESLPTADNSTERSNSLRKLGSIVLDAIDDAKMVYVFTHIDELENAENENGDA